MSGRPREILGRFPAHLEAARPGKQLGAVVEAVAADLDLLSADLAAVRRSHRLAHAETLRDVLLLAGLHGLGAADVDVLRLRAARILDAVTHLQQAVTAGVAADRDTWAETLFDLLGVSLPPPRLPLFAPRPGAGGAPDLDEAARRLARAGLGLAGSRGLLEGTRARVGRLCRLHAEGNGTVRALLAGAASALDLEFDEEKNRRVKDVARPVVTVTPAGTPGTAIYSYVVVARSLTRSVARASAPATTTTGHATLDAVNGNGLRWVAVPDALDYLVFRTTSTGTPAGTGLLTPTPLGPATVSFTDTGLAAGAALPPEIDDDLFHSRDLFWHSSFVRDRARLVRRIDPAPPPRTLAVRGRIGLDDLAAGLGTDVAGVLAAMATLAAAGETVDFTLDRAGALRVAGQLGRPGPAGATITGLELARQLGVSATPLIGALAAVAAAAPLVVSFDARAADAVASTFGVAVVEPRRVPLGSRTVVADLVRLLGATADAVRQSLAVLGLSGVDLDTAVSFEQARDVAGRMGFQVVAERVITLEGAISVADLATALGLRAEGVRRDLTVLGVDATVPVSVETAATVARKYFVAVEETLPAGDELIGMEENPLRREESDKRKRRHAELFTVLRRGFARASVQVHVTGVDNRTVGPLVVNRDESHGVGYAGAVAAGAALVFVEDGRVFLDGADVTSLAYAFKGACFADTDDDPLHPRDLVFDGPGVAPERRAVFAIATPTGALDPGFAFPHAGDPIPVPGIAVGRTRFAFFVQEAGFSHRAASDPPGLVTPVPRPRVGFADASVLGTTAAERPEAGDVSLSWLEHEAYAVRVLLPARFARFDGEEPTVADRVERALERLRPAGVEVRVEYLDQRWTLGTGMLAAGSASDPILSLRGGTDLWPAPPPGP